ncbi:MAG: glycosyltransferase family 2 protein [Acidimicrobiales bacterium]|nr:glycosyltransferase family 2 protein [Acidimicrobiales bacterium]
MPTGRLPAYAVVTPVRDEAEHFAKTADSLVAQRHRPAEWIIVDDGSTDGTRAVAEKYAAEHDWISVVDSPRAGGRARGAPIVRAFAHGRSMLRRDHEFVVKLDGDLFFASHYFAWVAETFSRDDRAGIVGGVAMIHVGGRWRPDGDDGNHVNGVAKAYRVSCLDEIGGLRASMGWDGIDEYSARARGWHVHVLTELSILHYKRRGSKQPWYRARWEEGRGNHYMGYGTTFLLVRALFRMAVDPPPVLGGLVLAAGFFAARIRGAPQVDDDDAVALLRAEQRTRLRGLARRRGGVGAAPLPDGGPAFWATADGEPRAVDKP